MEHTPIGRHGGASRLRKAASLAARSSGMLRFGRGRGFDLALAHGSNDLAIAAKTLGVPEANMHDYEYAVTQHRIGCRLAKRVMFPDSVPLERLRRFGVTEAEVLPLSRAEGGVLPLRLRARPGGAASGSASRPSASS